MHSGYHSHTESYRTYLETGYIYIYMAIMPTVCHMLNLSLLELPCVIFVFESQTILSQKLHVWIYLHLGNL